MMEAVTQRTLHRGMALRLQRNRQRLTYPARTLRIWKPEAETVFAFGAVLRALWGYLSLIFIARIVGRRPGKQYTPFEYVLIFFLGGLTLTGMVGPEASAVNAFTQIITIASAHFLVIWIRTRFPKLRPLLDGTPLVLMEGQTWRSRTMRKMGMTPEDVMYVARDNGLRTVKEIHTATLELNGEISVVPAEEA